MTTIAIYVLPSFAVANPEKAVSTHVPLDTPAYAYPSTLLDKARVLCPEIRIPRETQLQKESFLFLRPTADHTQPNQSLFDWVKQMNEYGIFSKQAVIRTKKETFVRFATPGEAQKLYTYLALKIHAKTALDPTVIEHTLWKESRGKENAVSHAGAVGISQTMPVVIQEILKKKKEAGPVEISKTRSRALSEKIRTLRETVHAMTGDKKHELIKEIARYELKKTELEILEIIPDFTISHPAFTEKRVPLPGVLHKKLGNIRSLSAIEYLALLHGPLNMSFGMAHMAHYCARINYYKKIEAIDAHTETILASQLAYNCGLSRLKKRIQSLGGWHCIFDKTPLYNGRRAPFLPTETAHYGYLFISWFMQEKASKGMRYMVHTDESYHLKMCLRALQRSKVYSAVIKELDRKGMSKKSGALQSQMNNTIWKGHTGTLTIKEIERLSTTLHALPQWPLTKQVAAYLDLLVSSSWLPVETNESRPIYDQFISLLQ